ANGFTTRALAAANGLSENSNVVLGSTIQIPTVAEAAVALQGGAGDAGESESAGAPVTAAAPPPAGSYVVRYGDSLSAIAARAGVSTGQLAWMNGLSVAGLLRAGTVLKLPSDTAGAATASAPGPAPVQRIVPAAAPSATPGHVSASQIGQVA